MARRFRVLVADDNEDAADSLAMLLELEGYEVHVAYDGETAVQVAERWAPDAAILDIQMPGRDGYSVARMLRAWLLQSVVLIAHSGQLTLRQRELGTASLFDWCCPKGAKFADLRAELGRLLEQRRPPSASPTGPRGEAKGRPAGPSRRH